MNDPTKQNLKVISRIATQGWGVVLAVRGLLWISMVLAIAFFSTPAVFNKYARQRENSPLSP